MGAHFSVGGFIESIEKPSFDMRHTLSLLTLAIVAVYLMAVSVEETQAYSYSGPRYNRAYNGPANRINRRGFKSSLLSTARGFGKRSDPSVSSAPISSSLMDVSEHPAYFALLLNWFVISIKPSIHPQPTPRLATTLIFEPLFENRRKRYPSVFRESE